MIKNFILCGVGGQGTVLASKIIAETALMQGMYVRTTETIGMAQRGGSVVSHVRISDSCIDSPLVPYGEAELILAFEPCEAVRCLPYLKKGGCVVTNSAVVTPVSSSLSGKNFDSEAMNAYIAGTGASVKVIDGNAVCRKCGSDKVLNTALLAAAALTGHLGITLDSLRKSIAARVSPKYLDINLAAISAVEESSK